MKVLVFSGYFYPEKTGIAVTATDGARFITAYDHQVTVVTAMPFYPEWKIHPEYRGKLFCTETMDGFTIKRHWLYMPKKLTTLTRILYEISFAGMAFFRLLTTRYDLLIIISPPLSAGVVAVLVNMIRRKRLWSSIKDIQPDAAIDLGMLKNKKIIAVSRWMEALLYRHSEKILVLSEGMKRNILRKNVPEEKVDVVPDSIDINELYTEEPRQPGGSKFRRAHGLEESFLVLYSGNLGIKHNVEIIVECAARLKEREDISFVIVGEGASKKRLVELIETQQLSNIRLLPLAERSELPDMLCSADLLLAPQRKEVIDIVVPSKLMSYLASGRPVIASAHPDSEAASLLNENEGGIVVPPEDPDALVEQIIRVKENPAWAEEIGRRGRESVRRRFDHEVVKSSAYKRLFG